MRYFAWKLKLVSHILWIIVSSDQVIPTPTNYFQLYTKFFSHLMMTMNSEFSIYLKRLIKFGTTRFAFQVTTKRNIGGTCYFNRRFFELLKTESCIKPLTFAMGICQNGRSQRINSWSCTIFYLHEQVAWCFEFKWKIFAGDTSLFSVVPNITDCANPLNDYLSKLNEMLYNEKWVLIQIQHNKLKRSFSVGNHQRQVTQTFSLIIILLVMRQLTSIFTSSHRRCSIKKGVLKNFAKFTGKDLCQSPFY